MLTNIDLLGGELETSELFTKSVTHVICTVPHRGEKFLSAVSAGCYVLHSDYVAKCMEQGFFLKVILSIGFDCNELFHNNLFVLLRRMFMNLVTLRLQLM